MEQIDIDRAGALLVETRRKDGHIANLPPELQPTTIAEAYAIQDAVVRKSGSIGGWKVSPASENAESRCSPILSADVVASGATLNATNHIVRPEIEVEIAVRLAKDLPPHATPYTVADVSAAIGSIHPALEVLSPRFDDRKSLPLLVPIADQQSNGAAVYGPARSDWQQVEFGTVGMTLSFDGEQVGEAAGGPSSAVVLESLAWLANHAAARTGGLKAGQVIITGARIKPVVVPKPGTHVEARVAGIGNVSAIVG